MLIILLIFFTAISAPFFVSSFKLFRSEKISTLIIWTKLLIIFLYSVFNSVAVLVFNCISSISILFSCNCAFKIAFVSSILATWFTKSFWPSFSTPFFKSFIIICLKFSWSSFWGKSKLYIFVKIFIYPSQSVLLRFTLSPLYPLISIPVFIGVKLGLFDLLLFFPCVKGISFISCTNGASSSTSILFYFITILSFPPLFLSFRPRWAAHCWPASVLRLPAPPLVC